MAEHDPPSGMAFRAHEKAEEALRRLDVIERVIEERNKVEERRHDETRKLILDLRGSFAENFQALQSRVTEALGDGIRLLNKRQDDHEKNDDSRFGVISNRSWSAMWALNGLLVTIALGLAAAVWKMAMH